MKSRVLNILISLVMLIGVAGVVPAVTVSAKTSGNYEYSVLDDGTVEITKYKGNEESVVIPSVIQNRSVTSIGFQAFYYCLSVKNVIIPDSVKAIGERSFYFAQNLTSVNIPTSVTTVGYYAFNGTGLTNVYIPHSVSTIGDSAFGDCTSLTAITVDISNANYSSQDGVLFNKDKKVLIQYPAGNTSSSYKVPSTVNTIADKAFNNCSNLESVTIQSSVNTIGQYAFYGCAGLKSLSIPNSVTDIEYGAFNNCTGLESVSLPDSLTKINGMTFCGCSSLDNVEIPSSVTAIDNWAFEHCTSLANITIPSSVTSFGRMIFTDTAWLENKQAESPFVIVNGVLIDGTACEGNVTIPKTAKEINTFAFYKCTALTGVTIPGTVTSIGTSAFDTCENLATITIPTTITSIPSSVFYACGLTDVYYAGTEAQWNAVSIGSNNGPLNNATMHYNYKGTAELKYQLRYNDYSTDVRFILIADEQAVIDADSASVYATIVDYGDTDSIIIKRAYRSIKAGGKTITAEQGKVFLIGKFIGIPDDMIDGMVGHFTLGENAYERTVTV